MTTELFQWATVVLLVLIWMTGISTRGLNQHLAELRTILERIEAILQANHEISEQFSMIGADIQDRMRDNFPTDTEREKAVKNSNPFG